MPRYGSSIESMKADAAQLAAMTADRERYTQAVRENSAEIARNTGQDRELAATQQNLTANASSLTAAIERQTAALRSQGEQLTLNAAETQRAAAAQAEMAAAQERAATAGRVSRGLGTYERQATVMLPQELQAFQRLQAAYGAYGGGAGPYGRPTQRGGGGPLALPEHTGPGFIGQQGGPPTIAGTANRERPTPATHLAQQTEQTERLAAAEMRANQIEAEAYTRLQSLGQGYRNASIQMAMLSDAEMRHGALTTEWITSLMRGEATLGELGQQMLLTIGKFGGWVAAAGLLYGAVKVFEQMKTGAKDASDAVANLSRFNLNNFNGDKAAQSFRDIALESNTSIKEVGEAAGQFGTIFKNQNDVMESARAAVIATKLDNISLADSYTGLTSAVLGFHEAAQGGAGVNQMLNEMNALQRFGGARIKDVLTGTGRAAGDYELAGGSRQYLEALIATMTRLGGISGTSAATAIARSATRFIHTPQNQAQLAAFGIDPNQGYDTIIRQALQVARRSTPNQRIQLAQALGGPLQGSRAFAPLFNNVDYFNKQLDIVQHKASDAATHDELTKMMHGLGQEAHKVGVEFQNLGSQLASSGLAAPFQALLSVLQVMASAAGGIVSAFHQLPEPLRDALAIMVAMSAATKVAGHFGIGPPGTREYAQTTKGLRGGIREMDRDIYAQSRRVNVAQVRGISASQQYAQFQTNPEYSGLRRNALAMTQAERAQLLARAEAQQTLNAEEQRMVAYLRQSAELKAAEMAAQERVTVEQGRLNMIQGERDVMGQQLRGLRGARGSTARQEALRAYQAGGVVGGPAPVSQFGAAAQNAENALAGGMGEVERNVNSFGRLGQRMQGWAGNLENLGRSGRFFGAGVRGLGGMAERVGTSAVAAGAAAEEDARGLRAMLTAERSAIAGFGVLDAAFAALIIGIPEFKKFVNNWTKASNQEINAPLRAPTDQMLAQQSAAARGAYGGQPGRYGGVMVGLNASQIQSQIQDETRLYQTGQRTRGDLMGFLAVALKEVGAGEHISQQQATELRAAIAEARSAQRAPGGGGYSDLSNIQQYANMLPTAGKNGAQNDPLQAYIKQYDDMLKAFGPATQSGQNALKQLGQIGGALFIQSQPTAVGGAGQDPTRFYAFLSQEPQTIKSAVEQHLQLHVALAKNAQELRQAYAQADAGYGQADQWIADVRKVVAARQGADRGTQQQAIARLRQAIASLRPNDPHGMERVATAQHGVDAANAALAADGQMLQALGEVGKESKLDTQARRIQNAEAAVDAITQRLSAATDAFAAMHPSNARAIDERKIADAAQAVQAAQKLPAWDPKRQEAIKNYYEALNSNVEDQLQQIQATGSVAQARAAATGDPVAQARAAQQSAQEAYNVASANRARLKPGEWEQIVATLIQAQTATADAVHQSAMDTIQADEQIAQARDYNNPQAQAQDALSAAERALAIARNPKERQAAEVQLAQAQSQAAQSAAQLVQSRFQYYESLTTDPLKQDQLKYQAALAAIKGAGGSNRYQALAQANQALQQWQQDRINTREQNIQFQLQMGQITTQQAIGDYQALLHMRGLTKQMRQQIQLQIHQWQTGTDSGGFDLRVGQNIKLPSLYDVRRAITAARAPDSGTLNQFETNVNLTIHNSGDDAYNNTIRALESALNTSIRSHMRAAGVRRRGRR